MSTVLVVGGGGREHALSPRGVGVLVGPGNAGTAREDRCHNVEADPRDIDAMVDLARREQAALVVVGPEAPLVAGLVDALQGAGIAAFGPGAAAAELEGSKVHAKEFMARHGVPTAAAAWFSDAGDALRHLDGLTEVPVVKASGLAAGKGVIVPDDFGSAASAIREMLLESRFGPAGSRVVLEERLTGTEVSILAFCDGATFEVMPAAQDHKRLLAGDEGPNTGGMGAFVPSPAADDELVERIGREVLAPTLHGLAEEGRPYRGVLYAGMMLTADGPKVIEYNCRFGDPETQVVLPLLLTDPLEVLEACATSTLAGITVEWSDQAAVAVVMASEGYPERAASPSPIRGLDAAAGLGCTVFHAGTRVIGGEVHASGGRVLAVSALGPDLTAAAELAHAGVAEISFVGARHRADIARPRVVRTR
ncbi:MAG: phosphoribosylamine--glycine ligase [Acidimicrobiales bacterium]